MTDRLPDTTGAPADAAHETAAREIAEAVLAVPGVTGLTGGPFGGVATYLPGARVEGVAVRDDEVEVDIVAEYGEPLPPLAERVRSAVAPLSGDRAVNVVVADLEMPSESSDVGGEG